MRSQLKQNLMKSFPLNEKKKKKLWGSRKKNFCEISLNENCLMSEHREDFHRCSYFTVLQTEASRFECVRAEAISSSTTFSFSCAIFFLHFSLCFDKRFFSLTIIFVCRFFASFILIFSFTRRYVAIGCVPLQRSTNFAQILQFFFSCLYIIGVF